MMNARDEGLPRIPLSRRDRIVVPRDSRVRAIIGRLRTGRFTRARARARAHASVGVSIFAASRIENQHRRARRMENTGKKNCGVKGARALMAAGARGEVGEGQRGK